MLSSLYSEWVTPYEEWPAELQEVYSYNPEKARELLAEAGHPDGFQTNIVIAMGGDSSLIQAIKAEFLDIGVDMEINAMDSASIFNSGL